MTCAFDQFLVQSNNNAAPICVWALHWVAGKEVDVKKCPQNVKKCPQIEPRLNGRPDGTRGQKLGILRHFLTHFDHDCGPYTVRRLTLIGCVYIVSAWLQNIDDSSAKQRMKKMKSVNMTDTQSEAPAKKTNLRRHCCPELKRKSVASWETSSHRFHQLFNQSSVTNLCWEKELATTFAVMMLWESLCQVFDASSLRRIWFSTAMKDGLVGQWKISLIGNWVDAAEKQTLEN